MADDVKPATEQFEKALQDLGSKEYRLRLFVNGETAKSRRAIANIEKICREHLQGRCRLEIVDAAKHPKALEKEQVVALPTLIKELPPPLQHFVGDLSDLESVLVGLSLSPEKDPAPGL